MDARWTETFEDFGDDCFMPYTRSELVWISPPSNLLSSEGANKRRVSYLKQAVASEAPKLPGVYGMIDATGKLIYVGKSKALRNRLLSYFMPNNEQDKAGRISQAAFKIVWEQQPSEFAALLREQQLIRKWLPRYNVVGMPNRRSQAFLCLGKGPAESFYLSRYNDPTAVACVGPLSGTGHLNRAIEILTRHYRLRDCSQKTKIRFSNQLTLFDLDLRAGCVRYELGNCLGPCLPGSSQEKYAANVDRAVEFMKTGASELLQELEASMVRAASNLHFETAAKYREDLRIMEWLSKRLEAFRKARDKKPMVYHVPSVDGRPIWYLLRFGGVADVMAAPGNAIEWKKLRSRINQWVSGETICSFSSVQPEDTLGLVASWMQLRAKGLRAKPNDDEPDNPACWVAPIQEMPKRWGDIKGWSKNKTKHRSVA